MHDQDHQRPTGCSDCGAFPTTAAHRCPSTTAPPVGLEQLVDDLEASAQRDIRELVERSSFGTPEAKRLRASVTDQDAARVLARVAYLDAECCSHPQPCKCPCDACEHERKRHAGTSRPVPAREVRASEAQVEAAMSTWDRVMPLTGGVTLWQAVADAVVAAGDADEVTRLRAEVEDWKAEVQRVDSERSAALTATTHDLYWTIDRAREAEAERDRLAEVVARVEALAASEGVWKGKAHVRVTERLNGYTKTRSAIWVDDLRAALSGPTPAHDGASDRG